jgi:CubicO group peptidase (beta-lactamase class C family)
VTGFSVVGIKDGKVVLLDAYGDLDPLSGRKANVDTRYYIASITKTMTATAILQLAEQGKVDLNAPVQRYLPRFDLADKQLAKSVKVRDLLSHRYGISGGYAPTLEAYTGAINDDRFYTALASSKPLGKPGYSNTHFTLLGRVIQAVTGKRWQDYLATNVFGPLGMARTTAWASSVGSDTNVAPPLVMTPGGIGFAPYVKTDRTMHAAGGVHSTARDMTKYMLAFMNRGALEGKQVLQPASVADAFSAQTMREPEGSIRKMESYGHAWGLGKYRDHEGFAAHGGGYTGYFSFVAMIPGKQTGMAVFVNTDGPGGEFGTILVVDAMDRLLGYPIDQRLRDNYEKGVKSGLERMKALKPIGPNPAISGQLSLSADKYVGRYENKAFGDVRVGLRGGLLTLDIGDLPQLIKSTGRNEGTMHSDITDPGTPFRFIVSGGKCTAVELNLNGWRRFDNR